MNRTIRLTLVAAAMTAFLIGMVFDHATRRASGTEVILDLEPVDPRDLLAGYYVIVSTPLHLLEPDSLGGDDSFATGDDIYALVEEDEEGVWQAVSIHRERPEAGVFLHGKVQHGSETMIRADYNLERFYADEETAQALELRRRENIDSMRLIVSVGPDGRAIIRGLEIDGQRRTVPLF